MLPRKRGLSRVSETIQIKWGPSVKRKCQKLLQVFFFLIIIFTGIVVLFPFQFIIDWMNKTLIRCIILLERTPYIKLVTEIKILWRYLCQFLSLWKQCIYASVTDLVIHSVTAAGVKQNQWFISPLQFSKWSCNSDSVALKKSFDFEIFFTNPIYNSRSLERTP